MSETATLLIEIGTEELPPVGLEKVAQFFADHVASELDALGMTFEQTRAFTSPRRLALSITHLVAQQPTRRIEKKGPSVKAAFDKEGKPTKAALGFAKSCSVELADLSQRETPQGLWLYHEHEAKGQPLSSLIQPIVEKALKRLPVPKTMRWSTGEMSFVRPVHWIVAMHGTHVLPITLFGLKASNQSRGHRFHSSGAITLKNADDYLTSLHQSQVLADPTERLALIKEALIKEAKKHDATVVMDEALLKLVSHLVEWPSVFSAHFDASFLSVPPEALISSMQTHQKCFALKKSGKLINVFLLVSNTTPSSTQVIIEGNERVMKARLSDAAFFFEQDKKQSLEDRLPKLQDMIFQKQLGTLYEKSCRTATLAGLIAKELGAPTALAERAGKLSKTDLITEMVFEFPELQGIMGSYYATNDGEPVEVATAIKESYYPRFANDTLPESDIGVCLSLADRLDTLTGIFGIGQTPTGDKDPFALRRQALAIVRIIIEKSLTLDLAQLCELAHHTYGQRFDKDLPEKINAFAFERFKAWSLEKGAHPQVIEAVLATHPTKPLDCYQRIKAVEHFKALPSAKNLASANKRVRNLLQKNNISLNNTSNINKSALEDKAEIHLYDTLLSLEASVNEHLANGDYQEALEKLSSLQVPVDTFFDEVMVMVDNETLKQNRLALLKRLFNAFMNIADISKLEL